MDNNNRQYRGRIAPTPSGLLHIGHAQTFKTAWERARERNGKIILRIEDIDSARCKKEYADAAIEDLKLIGLDWDEGSDVGGNFAPYTQSLRLDYYWKVLTQLSQLGLVYPCAASRALIKETAGKNFSQMCRDDNEPMFPVSLRNPCAHVSAIPNARFLNWRFKTPDNKKISFNDNNYGEISFTVGRDFGDFLVWRKSGEPSYELAVVADDIAMKITEVVRGADLLLSTARQILIYNALGAEIPEFYHCKLLLDEHGEKISKSSMNKSAANKWLIRAKK